MRWNAEWRCWGSGRRICVKRSSGRGATEARTSTRLRPASSWSICRPGSRCVVRRSASKGGTAVGRGNSWSSAWRPAERPPAQPNGPGSKSFVVLGGAGVAAPRSGFWRIRPGSPPGRGCGGVPGPSRFWLPGLLALAPANPGRGSKILSACGGPGPMPEPLKSGTTNRGGAGRRAGETRVQAAS